MRLYDGFLKIKKSIMEFEYIAEFFNNVATDLNPHQKVSTLDWNSTKRNPPRAPALVAATSSKKAGPSTSSTGKYGLPSEKLPRCSYYRACRHMYEIFYKRMAAEEKAKST